MACVVEGCKAHSSRKGDEDESLTYHRFPNDDEMKMKWIQCINRFNWTPTKHSRICSKHFTKDSFVPNDNKKWRRLKSDAVPLLNIPIEESSFVMKTEPSHSLSEPTSCQYRNRMELLNEIKTENTSSICDTSEISSFDCGTSTYKDKIEATSSVEPLNEIKTEDTSSNCDRNEISSFECSSCAYKDKIEASSEKKIRLLEKQVEKLKNISKRRLRRINTLTKQIARLTKKNVDLYKVLLDRMRRQNVTKRNTKKLYYIKVSSDTI